MHEETDESWARADLVIRGAEFTPAQVARRLKVENEVRRHKRETLWAARIGGTDSTVPLHDQLAAVRDFLRSHAEAIRSLPGESEVSLHVGWSPRAPQDSVGMGEELVALLASVGGYLVLDTYVDSDEEDE